MKEPGGFADVVARHWKDTAGYVVIGQEPCIAIAKDEVRHIRRRLATVRLDGIAALVPTGSWFMGVLVCAGDDLTALAEWAKGREAARVHFYLHTGAKATQLAPWRDAGLPLDKIDEGITSWTALHPRLGFDLNVQVFDDHRG